MSVFYATATAATSALSIRIPSPALESDRASSAFDSPHSPRTPQTPATPSGLSSGSKPRELAPFLRQLREMLENESPTILRWTPDGRAFEILDLHQMTHVVLPKYFKHAKYASFQRQLNYFSFRKWTKSKSPRCTFANPHFVRAAPELTWRITRKRDASARKHRLQQLHKRPRAQSLDPVVDPQPTSRTHGRRAGQLTFPAPTALPRDRAASESSLVGVDALRRAEPEDSGGLLQWIDDQFPSIASLALLDETSDHTPPVWTAYAPASMHPQPPSSSFLDRLV